VNSYLDEIELGIQSAISKLPIEIEFFKPTATAGLFDWLPMLIFHAERVASYTGILPCMAFCIGKMNTKGKGILGLTSGAAKAINSSGDNLEECGGSVTLTVSGSLQI